MNLDEFRKFLHAEAGKPFSGWDFSYLQHRLVTAPLDWSYPSILMGKLRAENAPKSLLDMGTGGGEILSRLYPFPPYTCATEQWDMNYPIAKERLEPLGVQVFKLDSNDPLPFADNQFELIINRHESYAPQEVLRILSPGGEFITQQVGAENDLDINRLLGAPIEVEWEGWNAQFAADELREAGFKILDTRECFPQARLFDVGALVYYLKAIPWQIDDFSIEKYFDPLVNLHHEIQRKGFVEIKSHRFLIMAKKP